MKSNRPAALLPALLALHMNCIFATLGCSVPSEATEKYSISNALYVQLDNCSSEGRLIVDTEQGALALSGQVTIAASQARSPSCIFIRFSNHHGLAEGDSFCVDMRLRAPESARGELLITALRPKQGSNSYIPAIGKDFDDGRVVYNQSFILHESIGDRRIATGTISPSSPVDSLMIWLSFPSALPGAVIDIKDIRVSFSPATKKGNSVNE